MLEPLLLASWRLLGLFGWGRKIRLHPILRVVAPVVVCDLGPLVWIRLPASKCHGPGLRQGGLQPSQLSTPEFQKSPQDSKHPRPIRSFGPLMNESISPYPGPSDSEWRKLQTPKHEARRHPNNLRRSCISGMTGSQWHETQWPREQAPLVLRGSARQHCIPEPREIWTQPPLKRSLYSSGMYSNSCRHLGTRSDAMRSHGNSPQRPCSKL